jgi:hypothetical protein
MGRFLPINTLKMVFLSAPSANFPKMVTHGSRALRPEKMRWEGVGDTAEHVPRFISSRTYNVQ